MNKFKLQFKFLAKFATILFSLGLIGGTLGCTEDIDDSNFAIKTEQTITDYLSTNDRYSEIKAIFDRVRLGNKANASVLTSVLSARGNYTIFVPSDSALNVYIKSLGKSSVSELDSAQAELIAYSCIIDNGSDAAYELADFPPDGSFSNSNLYDRLLTCKSSGDEYVINGSSRVILNHSDKELSNGFLHEVDKVITPSTDNLADMIGSADNMKIFSHLLEVTGWRDSIGDSIPSRRLEYEENEIPLTMNLPNLAPFDVPQKIYVGFTALVEPDDIYQSQWNVNLQKDADGNVTNWDEVMNIIKEKCSQMFSDESSTSSDLKNSSNVVNRFVAYHILDGRMAYNRFVRHFNEYKYKYGSDPKNPQTTDYPVNVWDYYPTLGKYRGLVKITQVGDTGFEYDKDHKIYVNRISKYNNGIDGDYREIGVESPGILINPTNGEFDNNAQNGFYYPISGILDYSEKTRSLLGSERIRFDLTTINPEYSSNNLRGVKYYYFPVPDFFKNIVRVSEGTQLSYLMTPGKASWSDYQGDEMLFLGLYDFTLRLPPVPMDGTYEIRMGTSNNSSRGMCQVYIGDNPYDLAPSGLPLDLRLGIKEMPGVKNLWHDDTGATEAEIISTDKALKNAGYMKGPKYMMVDDGSASNPMRNNQYAVRNVLATIYMQKDKTYYIRFKSALKKTNAQFFVDYFEFAPTSVYAGTEPEDIW